MANATVSRLGAINGGVDKTALFLKVFAGEVLTAFETVNVMMPRHMVKTISSGKSAQFPATGQITAAYHTPGEELVGIAVNHAERIITIDALLVAHAFIADIDEAMNHYDTRRIYSTEMGRRLSKELDINVLSEVIKAARASATVTGGNGGTTITDANLGSATATTKQQALVDAFFAAAQALDEKDAPEDRYAVLKPAEYYSLVKAVQSTGWSPLHKDYGGAGNIAQGILPELAGIKILKSNNLPITDTSGTNTYHGGDYSTTKGVIFTKEAVGTVKLLDLSMDMQWDIRRQGTLLVARYAMGHGILRPECAVELKTA